MRRTYTLFILFAMLCYTALVQGQTTDREQHISLSSTYLACPIEGYHKLTLVGRLAGATGQAYFELNPNACSLNAFGDPEVCTEIAVVARTVLLHRTRQADPLHLGRQHWAISGTPLRGTLSLIVPDNSTCGYRLVYESNANQRTVIPLESLVYRDTESGNDADGENAKAGVRAAVARGTCVDLARVVDGVAARAVVRPGFVNGTYILYLQGRKPHLNTWVEIHPAVYVRPPDYWRIDVKECRHGSIVLPTVAPYDLTAEITNSMGEKGIELHWAGGEVERIPKP